MATNRDIFFQKMREKTYNEKYNSELQRALSYLITLTTQLGFTYLIIEKLVNALISFRSIMNFLIKIIIVL